MEAFLTNLLRWLSLVSPEDPNLADFINISSSFLEVAAIIGVVWMIMTNEPLRKRRRLQDKLIFTECLLVIALNVLIQVCKILVSFAMVMRDNDLYFFGLYALCAICEALYMMILLQWLVCVDYSLNHSMDHLRRRYRHAAWPIVIVTILDILHSLVTRYVTDTTLIVTMAVLLHLGKLIIEMSYIIVTILMVKDYEKERREPRFLRLDAFIIPFLLGVLFRYVDASLIGLGVILTYMAMKRRDKYIDMETDLYNAGYLDCISAYWDKKQYRDSNALIVKAPGHGDGLTKILMEIRIPDCYIIRLDESSFVILTAAVRSSFTKMTKMLLTEQAEESADPFVPLTCALCRSEGKSAMDFAEEIRKAAAGLAPQTERGC